MEQLLFSGGTDIGAQCLPPGMPMVFGANMLVQLIHS